MSSMDDKVAAKTTLLSSRNDNMNEIMKKPGGYGLLSSNKIPLGRRLKFDTTQSNFLAVMEERVPHVHYIFNHETMLPDFFGSVFGEPAAQVDGKSLSPKGCCTVLDIYLFSVK